MSTKKIPAILMALVLLVVPMTACGNSGTQSGTNESSTNESSSSETGESSTTEMGDVPTISLMVICGSIPDDAADVAAKLSEITREKIGCNVEFITMLPSSLRSA